MHRKPVHVYTRAYVYFIQNLDIHNLVSFSEIKKVNTWMDKNEFTMLLSFSTEIWYAFIVSNAICWSTFSLPWNITKSSTADSGPYPFASIALVTTHFYGKCTCFEYSRNDRKGCMWIFCLLKIVSSCVWCYVFFQLTPKFKVLASVSPDGTVIISSRIQASLNCWMNLQMYPFDVQKCRTIFESCKYRRASRIKFQNHFVASTLVNSTKSGWFLCIFLKGCTIPLNWFCIGKKHLQLQYHPIFV